MIGVIKCSYTLMSTVKIHTNSHSHNASTLEKKNTDSIGRGANVHAHAHIFALADTLRLKTLGVGRRGRGH